MLRRWLVTSLDPITALDQTVRFNEVIDQALSESIRQYALRISQTRDRFAGILAHDLRSPLGADFAENPGEDNEIMDFFEQHQDADDWK